MTTSSIIMMCVGFGVTWGGACWCMRLAIQKHLSSKD
ncbi:MetS family NSS transporter small subunit [Desulfovibrio mangrovi]|nr:MetS family NSS transporter small subunit [Desulfovibrio mangrovi]UZP68240.1 MetS family NSS transporter small subunit [Desulfovibrio mangrovi]